MHYTRFPENGQLIEVWDCEAHEFWRRAARDVAYIRKITPALEQAITQYLDDVSKYGHWKRDLTGSNPAQGIMSDHFVHFFDVSSRHRLPEAWATVTAMMKEGLIATSVAQLSNWVTALVVYQFEPAEKTALAATFADGLRWLTTQPPEPRHPMDNLYAYLAAEWESWLPELHGPVATSVAQDTSNARVASRWMTVMQHTSFGESWWDALMHSATGSVIPKPSLVELPDPRVWLQRRERSNQAWWRYREEMEAAPEYRTMLDWVSGLRSGPMLEMELPGF